MKLKTRTPGAKAPGVFFLLLCFFDHIYKHGGINDSATIRGYDADIKKD